MRPRTLGRKPDVIVCTPERAGVIVDELMSGVAPEEDDQVRTR